MYVLRPGAVSSPRSLADMLRQHHDDQRRAYEEERDRRIRDGVPLDDTDPEETVRAMSDVVSAITAAVGAADIDAARAAVARASAILTPSLREPGPLSDLGSIADVSVRLRAMSYEHHRDGVASVTDAARAGDTATMIVAMRAYVAAAVVSVAGLEDDDGPVDATAETIEAAGLLLPLYVVSTRFQSLTGDEKKVFGRPLQTTISTQEIAAPVPQLSGSRSGVMVAPDTGAGRGMSTTGAHDATSSTIHGSPMSSTSTAPPAGLLV